MDSREHNTQFRFVPLIQRSEMERYAAGDASRSSVRTPYADGSPSARDGARRSNVCAYEDALEEPTETFETRRLERRQSSRSRGFSLVPGTGKRREPSRGRRVAWGRGLSWDDYDDYDDEPAEDVDDGFDLTGEYDDGFEDEADDDLPPSGTPRYDWLYTGEDLEDGEFVRPQSERTQRLEELEVSRDWLYSGEDRRRRAPGVGGLLARVYNGMIAVGEGVIGGAQAGVGALGNHPRSLFVLMLLALAAGMLFAPVRELYVANRKIDALQATYDQLLAENDEIRNQLELLQTQEGVENEARTRGYVEPGETKVIVEGLPESDASEGAALSVLAEEELPDNREWYVVMLDTLFGYDPEA